MIFFEDKLIASICRESFYEFTKEFWDVVINDPIVDNWHIKYLCDELQLVAEQVFLRKPKLHDIVINIPPGTTKSTIVSQMFPAWIWTRMPAARIIGASYTIIIALDLSRKNKDIISSEKYKRLFGITLKRDQSSKGYFVNSKGGYRYAVGTGGTVTGMHGDFLLVDDPINPKKSASESEIKTANMWLSETLPTRKTQKEVVPLIMVMQRLAENDPSGYIIKQRNESSIKDLKLIVLPAEDSETVQPAELRKKYINGLLDPIRLSESILVKLRRDLGEFAYAGQILQTPISRKAGMFRPEHFIMTKTIPCPVVKSLRYWDKAGSEGKNCYTAGVKLGLLKDGSYIVLDVVRGQWEPFGRNEIIQQTAYMDGKNTYIKFETEPGSSGKESSTISIRSLAGYKVSEERPTGKKALRAEPFASMVNSGNVYLLEGDWNAEFINELRYFPNGQYKDQTDAASAAFINLTEKKTVDYVALMRSEIPKKSTKPNGLILPPKFSPSQR